MSDSVPHSLPFDRPEAFLDGQVMVVDKPLTWTSFDVVNKLRFALRGFTGVKKIKVGHAGTLDPLATGVLVVCCGRATKTIDSLQAQAKVYTATMRLGAHTPSLDAETEVDRWAEDPERVRNLGVAQVAAAAQTLTGALDQRPPLFSAKKVDGVKAYDAARKGEAIALRTTPVVVTAFEVQRATLAEVEGHPVLDVDVCIACSKGTYIRSLARDLGDALHVGGTLTSLCRTASGDFRLTEAWNIDALVARLSEASAKP
ncbi:MAG: tRNA pseudouridine(55) synthase TruB [Bacteroidetes bacterium]|nr:tRNA pseudouridine(55) synthase TruB [Bacteroidota bacterium]MDA0904313.1 tRNA pseudouridine(55) synthase TruB [Bacteroidota bacterium]MDA1242824.1 tRNA pseudouridine(55) synthase TruB [Bacteroidota bacterium]